MCRPRSAHSVTRCLLKPLTQLVATSSRPQDPRFGGRYQGRPAMRCPGAENTGAGHRHAEREQNGVDLILAACGQPDELTWYQVSARSSRT